jgi:hypothetical protein
MAIDTPLTQLVNFIIFLWCSFFGCGTPNTSTDTAQSTDVIVVISSSQSYAREVQAHSSTLYKVSQAIFAERPSLTNKFIAQNVTKVCTRESMSNFVINNEKFNYGWSSAPKNIRCTVEPLGTDDFKVTVRGETGVTSINGFAPR